VSRPLVSGGPLTPL
jgi:hypothetical protein